MVLDGFQDLPGLPFPRWWEDMGQFASARRYWLAVVRSAGNWVEDDWEPKFSAPLSKSQILDGQVVALTHRWEPKELRLHTTSIKGQVAGLLDANADIGAEEAAAFGMVAGAVPPMSRAEAEDEVRRTYAPFGAWVEPAVRWRPRSDHPDGGVEVPVERLILTAEISDRAEPLARKALRLFLAAGPAMRRVNDVFAAGPE